MWNDLSMADRAKYIQLGVSNGVTNLDDIRESYNSYTERGYKDWINKVKEWRPGIDRDIDSDNPTYDYKGFYEEDIDRAWKMLEEDPEAHFTDKFKRPNHPTFSDESIYSNDITKGGHWAEPSNGNAFYIPSYYTGTPERLKDTRDYLTDSGEGYLDIDGVHYPSTALDENRGYDLPELLVTNSRAYGGRVNKFDIGGNTETQQVKYPAKNEYLRSIGIGQRPYSELTTADNMDFYDIQTGDKVNNDNANSNTMVWVDPYSGIPINANRLFNDNNGNLNIASLNNDIVIRPYQGYREQLYPYHDTFRMHRVPVASGVQDDDPVHPIIPFQENEYFETPQLIGEDNWHDPSENIANYALTGITGLVRNLGTKTAIQLTGDLLTSNVGGELFRKINPESVDNYPLYNLGYLANTRMVTYPTTKLYNYSVNKIAHSPTNIQFIRNIGTVPEVDDLGNFYISPEENALANFTWDKSFRTHRHYKTRPGAEYMLIKPESLKGERFLSTDPMDSFIPNRKLPASDVTIISGNPETRALAESRGFKTLSSEDVDKAYRNLNFSSGKGLKLESPFRGEKSVTYDNAVNSLIHSTYGKPNILDALKLKLRTGINPHIKPWLSLQYNHATPIEYRLGKQYNFPPHPSKEELPAEQIEFILNSLGAKSYNIGGYLEGMEALSHLV